MPVHFRPRLVVVPSSAVSLAVWLVLACGRVTEPSTASSPPSPHTPLVPDSVRIVAGTITDTTGHPLAGSGVAYGESADGFESGSVAADSAGRYVLRLTRSRQFVSLAAYNVDPHWSGDRLVLALGDGTDTIRVNFTLSWR